MIAGHQDGPNFRVHIWVIGCISCFLSFWGAFYRHRQMSLSLHLPRDPSGEFQSPTLWFIPSLEQVGYSVKFVCSFLTLISFSSLSLGVSPAREDALPSCLWSCEFAALPLKHREPLLVLASPWTLLFCTHLFLPWLLAVCTNTPLAFPCQLFGVTEITPASLTGKKKKLVWTGNYHRTRWSLK